MPAMVKNLEAIKFSVQTIPFNVKHVERLKKAEREAREGKRGLWE
jgi:endonuclease YncB( thermonuclease family)